MSRSVCTAVFLSVIFLTSLLIVPARAQQRDASIGEVWHSYWKLPGALERRFNMETAVLMQRVERNPNATSTTIIESQTINIERQINSSSLSVGNMQSTNITDSQNVKVVHGGIQKNDDTSVGAHVTIAGGDATSTNNVSIVDQGPSTPPQFKKRW